MSAKGSQITGVSVVHSTVCLGVDQRKHQSSASLAFVRGIHRWSVNSPHKGPVTRKIIPFDDVIMRTCYANGLYHLDRKRNPVDAMLFLELMDSVTPQITIQIKTRYLSSFMKVADQNVLIWRLFSQPRRQAYVYYYIWSCLWHG